MRILTFEWIGLHLDGTNSMKVTRVVNSITVWSPQAVIMIEERDVLPEMIRRDTAGPSARSRVIH